MRFYVFRIERVFSKSGRKFIVASKSGEELIAFTGITNEKMAKLLPIINERIADNSLHEVFIKNIMELGYQRNDAENIVACFYNFYNGLDEREGIEAIIEYSELGRIEKNIIKEAFHNILKSADRKKIDIIKEGQALADYGHPHLHTFGAKPEFRLLTRDGKIVKIVPSIVITGHVHNPVIEQENSVINFQVSIESLEDMINDLNIALKNTKTQISELKKQLGEEIVSER